MLRRYVGTSGSVVTQTVWDTVSWSMEDDETTAGIDEPSLIREVGRGGVRELKSFLFRHGWRHVVRIRERIVRMRLCREGVLWRIAVMCEHEILVELPESWGDWLAHRRQVCRLGHVQFHGEGFERRRIKWLVWNVKAPLLLGEFHSRPVGRRVQGHLGLRCLRG
jgi:hypothetical protein